MDVTSLPWHGLPGSSRVDFLQFLTASKPAVRLHVNPSAGDTVDELTRWAHGQGLHVQSDQHYICVARTAATAADVLRLDATPTAHERALGIALGYPPCCCEAAAAVGEECIDEWEALVGTWHFAGRYRLIDPSRYRQGKALISHIPCSSRCGPSWMLADKAVRGILGWLASAPTKREPWATWQETIALLSVP